MKKYAAALLTLMMTTGTAQADMFRTVSDMAVVCTEDVGIMAVMPGEISIDVIDGLEVLIGFDGKDYRLSRQVTAGTEGGDPYIQIVENGVVNVLLSGEALNQAFYNNVTGGSGKLTAYVDNLSEFGHDFEAECKIESGITFQ